MSGGLTFQVNEKHRAGKIGAAKCWKKIMMSYFVYMSCVWGCLKVTTF